eukprot:TRINITY_DN2730_c1_g1_i11.p2 TRINITY_DN2730_c1_g1~~TRINITY_DN2730_c1_g1_i11.p2  ORF type:complete len:294 (+),score=-20.78 TRINITY_DN2730_c1_g1_i11:135-884(+)
MKPQLYLQTIVRLTATKYKHVTPTSIHPTISYVILTQGNQRLETFSIPSPPMQSIQKQASKHHRQQKKITTNIQNKTPLFYQHFQTIKESITLARSRQSCDCVNVKNPDRHLLRFNVVRSNKQTNEHTLYTRYTFLYLETINITQYNKLRQTTFFTQNKTNWQKLPLRVFQSHVETFSQQTILQAQSTKAPQPDQPHINYSPQDILEGHGLQSNSNSNKCPKCLQIQTKPKKHFQTYFEWQQNITIFLQ